MPPFTYSSSYPENRPHNLFFVFVVVCFTVTHKPIIFNVSQKKESKNYFLFSHCGILEYWIWFINKNTNKEWIAIMWVDLKSLIYFVPFCCWTWCIWVTLNILFTDGIQRVKSTRVEPDYIGGFQLAWFLWYSWSSKISLFLIMYMIILMGNSLIIIITKMDPSLQTHIFFFPREFFFLGNMLCISHCHRVINRSL